MPRPLPGLVVLPALAVPAPVCSQPQTRLATCERQGRKWDRRGVTLSSSRKFGEQSSLHLPREVEGYLLELNAHVASLPLWPGEWLSSAPLGVRVEGSMSAPGLLLLLLVRPSFYKQGNKVLEGRPHLRSHNWAGAAWEQTRG